MLKENGIQEWIFKEIKSINEAKFLNWRPTDQVMDLPVSVVLPLATAMQVNKNN